MNDDNYDQKPSDLADKLLANLEIQLALKRIESIEDPWQQGYQTAPLIQKLTGAPVEYIVESIVKAPSLDATNALRDRGMLSWCHEQLEKQNEEQ